MALTRQPDLFLPDDPDLFEDRPSPVFVADPEEVRADLHLILAEARAAKTLPWDDDKASLYQVIFPQMSRWLPDDEAAQLCLEFDTELARLKAV
jgi:hypothetical protein